MDFQSPCVQYVRDELRIPAVCCGVEELGAFYSPASFDLLMAFHVLEHVPDIGEALQAVIELLKPGGWFVGVVPLINSLQARFFGSKWAGVTDAPRHLSLPSSTAMLQACTKAGFTNIQIHPDSVVACAAQAGLSLVPGAATTYAYGSARFGALKRAAAAAGTLLSIPVVILENYVLRRPPSAMVFAQKPANSARPGEP
jgi:SAM-dependent methyltransferase